MSKTIDITLEKTGTSVDVEYQDNLQNEILVSLSRGTGVEVDNVAPFITVDFGSLPQNVYWDEIQDKPDFHPVATSGDYDDLENKPNLHQVATTGDYQDLENKPNLSEVATSGDYGDLTGKPKINNVTLDGNKSAADLGLATAAQGAKADTAYQKPIDGIPGSDMSAAVQSALEKAETALQEHQSLEGYATEAWVEDQGYLTEHQDISGKADKSDTYTKQEVDAKMASAMHYKGSVANYDALLLIQDAELGDMYNVLDTGHNYAWDGAAWDIQSGIVDLSGKQDTLVSGENIKTINGESILGSGNIVIQGGGGTGDYEDLDNLPSINNVELIGNKTASDLGLQTELTIDATPTEDSTNPVQSGGVYDALEGKADERTFEVLHIHQIPIDIASGLLVGDFVVDTSDGKRLYVVTYRNANDFWLVTSDGVNLVWYSYENNQYSDNGFFDSSIVERDILELSDRLDGKQDTISDLATIRSGAALGATAIQSSEKGAASGVATLDSGGKVPQSQLPSYVDDVLEHANLASFPATGESGKIYVALDTNKTYRWSGSAYVEISQSLALGETSSTAFAGDRGKAIEDKIPSSASSSNKLATASDVNGKLSAPSTAGTSGQVLTSDGQGGQSWQTPQSGGTATDVQVNGTSITSNNVANIVTNTAYNASSNKIATMSDLPSVPVTDVTVGGTSVVSGGVAVVPAIPTVPTISTDIASDATSDTKTTSPKAVKTFVENKGYGTYSKPSGGIPASDLASGVIPNSVVNATSQQDGTVVLTKVNGDTITIDLNHVHPQYYSKEAETTQPSGGMLPDVIYKLGTLTGATTFSFAAAVSGNLNHYYFTFTSGSTAVVPTWPASITSWDGNCVDSTTGLPVIAASKTYEVSVLDGNAIIKEW